jgi:hypothetical protein
MNTIDRFINGEIVLLDNVLPNALFYQIKEHVEGINWGYSQNTVVNSSPENKLNIEECSAYESMYMPNPIFKDSSSFYQIFFDQYLEGENRMYPKQFALLQSAMLIAFEELELQVKQLIRIRCGMILNENQHFYHYPHVDFPYNHFTALFYLTSCQAPTKIFNESYDPSYSNSNDPYFSYRFIKEKLNNKLTTHCEIDSVENRIVIFNGNRFHSSSVPVDSKNRIVINYNFTV